MILELDIGNSRIKWRLLDADNQISSQGIVPGAKELQQLAALSVRPESVRACSVRQGGALDEVKVWLDSTYDLPIQIAAVKRNWGGVEIQYDDPTRLGVDRWLAMLAAYSRVSGACIIVDGGTALTIDVLAADGLHQGGYILPGLTMMRASIEQNTAIRLNSGSLPASLALGHSTDQAIWHGSLALATALIEKTAIATSAKQAVRVIFSGGDADILAEAVDFGQLPASNSGRLRSEKVADLVLDGLAIAYPNV